MQQADGLALTISWARQHCDLSLICFTGYSLERLRSRPPNSGVPLLLAEVDVLIDGPYIESRNNSLGLRGSANQTVHHLTDRLRGSGFDFEFGPRTIELQLSKDSIQMIGVPTRRAAKVLNSIMQPVPFGPESEGEVR
jgi:anaerobic ribonucleoside-triphosphate reductase activating protein